MQITCKYNADGMQLLMQMIVLSLETTAGATTPPGQSHPKGVD